jgi:16S rRNA (guanine527-N7)-methyltransferase
VILEDETQGAVEALFGARAELAVRYVRHLSSTGLERGLIGPGELPRMWERHVLNCAAVSELIAPQTVVVDVGSGAGLPGLVLAIARPDLGVTLVEPLLRRTEWLEGVVRDLDLANVRVWRGRAEEFTRADSRVVTARAVAPLGRLWGWCGPLLEPGGELLALKGATAAQELEGAAAGLAEQGVVSSRIVACGAGLLRTATLVVVLTKSKQLSGGLSGSGARKAGSASGRRRQG